jgi:hypothetical protein
LEDDGILEYGEHGRPSRLFFHHHGADEFRLAYVSLSYELILAFLAGKNEK